MTVNLIAPNNPDIKQMAEVIQSMTSEAGFDVKITAMEFASSLDLARSRAGSRRICSPGRAGSIRTEICTASCTATSGSQNYGRYSSPEMDKLLDDGRLEQDLAKRKALYGQIAALAQKDLPISYIYTTRYFNGLSSKVSGFKPVADGLIRLQGITLAP